MKTIQFEETKVKLIRFVELSFVKNVNSLLTKYKEMLPPL